MTQKKNKKLSEFSAQLLKQQHIYGYENADVAKALNCSLSTYANHKRYPDRFTVRELAILRLFLRLSDEDMLSVFKR